MADAKWCDLVLEGGGVKGLGLVGAFTSFAGAGYTVRRVAGTSAGAVVGSLVAAGMPVDDMLAVMKAVDYRLFRDEDFLDQFGAPGKIASLAFTKGIYKGDYLHEWLSGELEKLGVRTFADLKITDDWAKDLPPEQRYKLVVVASDITGGRLARLPWDYARYGLNPDEQPVADAVRASMSIPFFYQPAILGSQLLVDGGMLSNFPIDLFDGTPDWPTFGIKLTAKPEANLVANPVNNTIDFAKALLATMINAHDQMHIDDPATQARTMFIDTFKVKATDFDIDASTQTKLYASGQKAASKFLDTWDFKAWRKNFATKG
ncbi:MAG TPA: patatin-like phospholipase family protein [Candidatus Saccharimonadales bacterium]|nr:patatin-like phospholipase family protein [Candidatus Saccharimonadales bacterium]